MANKDYELINRIFVNYAKYIDNCELLSPEDIAIEHPLDEVIIASLREIKLKSSDNDFVIFQYLKEINELWKSIIGKSIKCLRYFDTREPFLVNKLKKPVAYGVKELGNYFDEYTKFESMLYGGGKYYRDHVLHVFRTWLLGVDCLLDSDGKYLDRISIGKNAKTNPLEKLSIWSMIALTHDLGYPLEKSQEIIDKTKDMMKSFIVNPIISMDLSFNGVQNNMNDFVLRFLSSKMHEQRKCPVGDVVENTGEDVNPPLPKTYVARLQPKFYFKFQKSLEKSMHGIISSIIIYKLLIYFLESDYNINEDYTFKEEDVRQFYIRREILRSISAHTCDNIYHLDMLTFAFLLIVVDDSQDWGRKRISELYVKSDTKYEFKEIKPVFDWKISEVEGGVNVHKCTVREEFTFVKEDLTAVKQLLKELYKQSDKYKEIFRDGQETVYRNFTFVKKCKITYQAINHITLDIEFIISNDENSSFKIIVGKTSSDAVNTIFDMKSLKELYKDSKVHKDEDHEEYIKYSVLDKNG